MFENVCGQKLEPKVKVKVSTMNKSLELLMEHFSEVAHRVVVIGIATWSQHLSEDEFEYENRTRMSKICEICCEQM